MQIGFCGLGRMGAAMVARLLDLGQKPIVWNRSPDRVKPVVAKGARSASTPAEVAAQSDIVLSILLDEPAVRAVYDGKDGLLSGDIKGKLLVDMSTVAPTLPQELAQRARAKGAGFLECPVGGTVGPAREGRLIGMVGGDQSSAVHLLGSARRSHRADPRIQDSARQDDGNLCRELRRHQRP